VDAQTIGVATAVISGTVAALALLLNWHREQDPPRPRLFRSAAVAVFGLGVTAVALVFALGGSDPLGTLRETDRRLTEAEYRDEAGMVCANLIETLNRLMEIRPRGPFGLVEVAAERTALRELRRLKSPIALEANSRNAIALWSRRVTLLNEVFRQREELSAKEAATQIAEVNSLTNPMNRQFRRLDLRECVL